MQYSIFGLMVLTFVVSVAVAPLYYVMRAVQGETAYRPVAVLMAVGMPMLMMTLLSIAVQLKRWLEQRKRKR
jgi:hypothetical protein